ncbi:MAG: dephospho-CoA kinase, partial [Gammaproteobacteria bacterium]
MLKIGLTGGIGSGKTAVSDQFQRLGINIIDTDIISRELLNHNPAVLKKVVETFSDRVLDGKGAVDRKKLAQIVFSNKKQKQQLENILHPAIRNEVKQQIQHFSLLNSPPEYLIIVIPLLLETGFTDLIDRILVVVAEENSRVDRIKQRDDRSFEEIHAIISSQVNDDNRIRAADDIIENNNNIKDL